MAGSRSMLKCPRRPVRRMSTGAESFPTHAPSSQAEISMLPTVAEVLSAAQERAAAEGLSYFGAVTPEEAHALATELPNARLIDVRTRAEWDFVGHIPRSVLIEWNSYPAGARNPAFLDELRALVPDPETPLLFVCRSGQRSDSAARAATAAGYHRAFNVLEGFEGPRDDKGHRGTVGGWRKAGLPWVQG